MKKTTVQLIDDLDGSVIADGAGGTVSFALAGRSYEIDLSDANIEKLEDLLQPYIDAARSTSGRSARRSPTSVSSGDLGAIREWARANGHVVGDRGRVSSEIREAYSSATGD